MKNYIPSANQNRIATYLGKPQSEFTKNDLIRFIINNNIQIVNFRYVAGDGKLKSLSLAVRSKHQLDWILASGERVDGSSLFSYIDSGSADLYVIPRFRTAFVNPFSAIPAVDILCSYYNSQGEPLGNSPENVVRKAHKSLQDATGLSMEAMGELEFYIIAPKQDLYRHAAQQGYHTAGPFIKWENLRNEAMQLIVQTGGKVKYSHSEVGNIPDAEYDMEQHEIELFPIAIEDAADQVVLAKWILRMLGHKYGVNITFAPKIMVGHAGSGLHIHTKLVKGSKNMMVKNDALSDTARKAIAGYLTLASSLTAFGNTVPISYLRLVPHQEAPTNICWGDRNRSVLVRVPLGWLKARNMTKDANPKEKVAVPDLTDKQTVEFRCPDGSANIHFLMAGLAVAARHGLEMPDALEVAKKLYVDVNIFHDAHKNVQENLNKLPASCWESAASLLKDRKYYERDNVFSAGAIDGMVKKLQKYNDKDLSERLYGKNDEIKKLVDEYLHYA